MSKARYIVFLQLCFDICVLIFIFYISQKKNYSDFLTFFNARYKILTIFFICWFFMANACHLYFINRRTTLRSIIKRILFQLLSFCIIVFAVSGAKSVGIFDTTKSAFYFSLSLFFFVMIFHIITFIFYKNSLKYGKNRKKVIFIDQNPNTETFIQVLKKRRDYGIQEFGAYFTKDEIIDFLTTENTENVNNISIAFISLSGNLEKNTLKNIIRELEKNHIQIQYIPDSMVLINNLHLEYYDTFPILSPNFFPLDKTANRAVKRAFDIIFSILVIVLIMSWLYPIITLLIKMDSKGPILFKQKRSGIMGKPFYCFKFRTMKPNKDAGTKVATKNDTRITKVGKFLRKTSLDEFPQFFNVFLGNMSVVGPRPHMIAQDHYYNNIISKYNLRHHVKPGITGLAQSSGMRGEITCDEDMLKRVIADGYYVKNWSFFLDLYIIGRTAWNIITGDKQAY